MSTQPQGLKPGVAPSPWDGHPLYSLPPDGWKDQQFDYTFSFDTADNDVWVRLYFPTGEAMQPIVVLLAQLAGGIGSTTDDNEQSPIWPEVVIPPGGILSLDALAGTTPFNGFAMRFDTDSYFYFRGIQALFGEGGGEGPPAGGFTLILNGVKRYQVGSELCPLPGGAS